MLCRSDLNLSLVYQITRTWFLAASRASGDDPMAGTISPARTAATPIPLHAGAARYYRERQLLP